jgi:hypothetical protein
LLSHLIKGKERKPEIKLEIGWQRGGKKGRTGLQLSVVHKGCVLILLMFPKYKSPQWEAREQSHS